jgi:beta-lactamase regulating signal transducer with metallopeptidase domain
MQSSLEYFKKALQIKRLLSYMIDDLIRSRYILLLSLLFAMIILLIYMFLLRYLARWMIWLSILLCILVFALAAMFCFVARNRMKKYSNNNNLLLDLDEMNITFNANEFDNDQMNATSTNLITKKPSAVDKFDTAMILLDDFAPMSVIWLILGIVCCVICGILMICTCCLCERIMLAAGREF